MGWVILILVVLAAAFGVLGAVLKAAAFLVLTALLTVVVLVTIGWYALRHQARRLLADVDARMGGPRTDRLGNDAGTDLPPPRDDRY